MEFRAEGRLGCPHDYVFFQKELDPLLLNIHGELEHTGKRPTRVQGNTDRQTDLIRLRREDSRFQESHGSAAAQDQERLRGNAATLRGARGL